METTTTDCLVLGAGLAGSAYALRLARAGFTVDLLSAGGPFEANTDWAQGGVIFDESPDPSRLRSDILEASDQTANPVAVDQLVREGPDALRELLLDDLQIPFDRNSAGELDRTREGGHAERRIIHTKDATGHAILARVADQVDRTPGIRRHSGWSAVDLLTLSHNSTEAGDRYQPLTCFGCYALNVATGEVRAWTARKTVLATGGLGGIFRHSTNQPGSVGSGVAMAYRVGARLIDLEYIQFHPTALLSGSGPAILVTEALRGEGAVLVDSDGRRFMESLHPQGSLAPRDIVARSIKQHLAATGTDRVFLDVSALPAAFLTERFPGVVAACRARGIDPHRDRIPVVPAAHFSCGGVHADLNGRTNVHNLNAIGETACTGLHGANRLASTSLLECLVAAKAAGLADISDLNRPPDSLSHPRPWRSPSGTADLVLVRQDLELIQNTMWNYAGIIRSPRRLSRARRILLELREDIQAFYRDCRPTRELINLRNAVQVALLVVHAASHNPVSRGCHFLAADE